MAEKACDSQLDSAGSRPGGIKLSEATAIFILGLSLTGTRVLTAMAVSDCEGVRGLIADSEVILRIFVKGDSDLHAAYTKADTNCCCTLEELPPEPRSCN